MKRGVIESVNDILMTVFDIDHTRHRSPINALCHLIGGLVAYDFYPTKPTVIIPGPFWTEFIRTSRLFTFWEALCEQ